MDNLSIALAIQTLRPGAYFNIRGSDISGIEWTDSKQTRPTDSEILAAIAAYVPPPTLEDRIKALEVGQAQLQATLSTVAVKVDLSL